MYLIFHLFCCIFSLLYFIFSLVSIWDTDVLNQKAVLAVCNYTDLIKTLKVQKEAENCEIKFSFALTLVQLLNFVSVFYVFCKGRTMF